jgi:uncharacterized protein YcfJ
MPVSSLIASTAIAATVATQTVPVESVSPIIRNEVVTVHTQSCQQVADNSNQVVGGIIGGLIGSQIGRSEDTRRVMTGVGAIIGSQSVTPGVATRCAPTYSQQAVPTVVGYNVTYILNGVRYSTVMSYNPGSHVTVQPTHTVR